VEFDKGTEVLTFKDANKRIILQEKVGGRFMKIPVSVQERLSLFALKHMPYSTKQHRTTG